MVVLFTCRGYVPASKRWDLFIIYLSICPNLFDDAV